MILFRPVGVRELELIAASGFQAFPPRLQHQPIFYPVLSIEYAERIARDWNTTDEASGYAGFVTQFEVEDRCVKRHPVRTAGSRDHRELWVPADELEDFNRHIIGRIIVTASFAGPQYEGRLDDVTHLPVGLGVPYGS